jgi:hypothetical protein
LTGALPTSTEPGAQPRVVASIADYSDFLDALRLRAKERKLAVSSEAVAEVAGLPGKYIAKLLQPNPIRRVGAISMGPVLAVLGVRLLMVEDTEALERYGSRLEQRNDNLIHHAGVAFVVTQRKLRQNQAKGRRNRWAKMSPAQRAKWARRMNKLRWGTPKSSPRARRWSGRGASSAGSEASI